MADNNLQQLLQRLEEISKPINDKLVRIEEKMSLHATKDDMLRLREELTDLVHQVDNRITTNYVQKELYETRHNQLIERDRNLDDAIRAERLERDKYVVEYRDRLRQIETGLDKKFKESRQTELNDKDRAWIRASQVMAWVAIALSVAVPIAVVLLSHVQFH